VRITEADEPLVEAAADSLAKLCRATGIELDNILNTLVYLINAAGADTVQIILDDALREKRRE
jgi:thiamine monophosphate synthase